jgi:anti-sigma-K factor RskA
MSEEREIDAAEYALGTLSADERARMESRLKDDPALREAVRRWQTRLAPLDDTARAETPRPEVWRAIEQATSLTGPAAEPESNVVHLRRQLGAWRTATMLTGALAAGLAVFVLFDQFVAPPASEAGRYIAVVDSGGVEPALIAAVDTTTGLIRIRRLTAEAPAGRSLELWHVGEGQAPRSLGLLQTNLEAQTIGELPDGMPIEGTLAVSVEPAGGSPSGSPTGPIVYSGRLIRVE